jgi:hypothetical protein
VPKTRCKGELALLFGRFDPHKTRRWPAHGLAYCLGIGSIVLFCSGDAAGPGPASMAEYMNLPRPRDPNRPERTAVALTSVT